MSAAWPPELTLAAACCHWPHSSAGDERVRAAAEQVGDWDHFDAIVQRNRITALAHGALTRGEVDYPGPVAQRLAIRARAKATRELLLAAESLRLQTAFDAAAIPFMVVKGIPLAMLAYGAIGIKESSDIDCLVAPEEALNSRRLLLELGYVPGITQLDANEFERFVEHDKEAVFVHPRKQITTELHWRLTDHRHLLRGVDVAGPAQLVGTPSGSLRTLADEPLFAFLCIHGAAHNWSRLKWLADVGAFLGRRSDAEVEAICRAAQGYGAGRSAAVALRLCHGLLGFALSDRILGMLEDSRATRALQANALAGLAYRGGAADPPGYSPRFLREKAAQFLLAPGARHFIAQAGVLWNSPTDRARIPLPRRLSFLYHVLRVPLWLGWLGKQVVSKRH